MSYQNSKYPDLYPEWDGMPLGYTGMDELPEIDTEPEDEETEPTEADKYDSLIDDDEERNY